MDEKFEAKFTAMDEKFEAKFTAMDEKFEAGFAGMERKVEAMDRKLDSRFQFLIGAYVTSSIALGGIFFAAISPLYAHLAH